MPDHYTKLGPNCAPTTVTLLDEARAESISQNQTCQLILDAGAEAIKFKEANPSSVVVFRFHGIHGDANWEHMAAWGGPEAYLDAARATCNNNAVVLHFMNESGVLHTKDVDGELPKNVQCALAGLEYAHLKGWPIAINMDGTGGPDDSEIQYLVPLYRRMNEINAERGYDFAYIAHHEYYLMHDPRYIGLRNGVMVNYDPMSYVGDDPSDLTQYNNWVCGRFARVMYILERNYDLETTPPVVITEFGADDTISQFHGPWPPDYPSYWLSEEQYAADLIWLMKNIYDPHDKTNPYYKYAKRVVGLNIFMFGNSGGWEGFDYLAKGVFRSLLNSYALSNYMEEEVPETLYQEYEVVSTTNLNIRDAASLTSNVVGTFAPGAVVVMDTNSKIEADGYLWLKFYVENGGDQWSAMSNAAGTSVYLELVEEDEPDDPGDTDDDTTDDETAPVTREEFDALKMQVAIIEALYAELKASIPDMIDVKWKPYTDTITYVGNACGTLQEMLQEISEE